MAVISTEIDDNGNRTDTIEPQAFDELGISDTPIPPNEQRVFEEIGSVVRSLVGDNTRECSVTVERVELVNDTPYYELQVEFSSGIPLVILQCDTWDIKDMRHKGDHTVAQVRYDNVF